ncbi:hypothetical protein MIB92_04095 [Aestuariirhabdus sp. Z084]|uniref:hypothetical protein n=1 Tax=Aestuariirhabdus haliotis TaxID=2918751 RepID=UPI00201B3D5B|nr:hypothetical protein [Aestuariirhabdus haliotis]MCL6414823.1 hypothetical protein [Aestuariirhabdus haliotis]MCL6418755.1 hypothetical protein [Aestuariirhabdus haliotis]
MSSGNIKREQAMITVATPSLKECTQCLLQLRARHFTLKRIQGRWIATLSKQISA